MTDLETYKKAFFESDALNIQWSRKDDATRILMANLRLQLIAANDVIKHKLELNDHADFCPHLKLSGSYPCECMDRSIWNEEANLDLAKKYKSRHLESE